MYIYMGKLNLKLGCLVYPCFSCSTSLFTEKSLHKDLPVVILRYFYKDRKTHVLHERHNPTDLICTWYCLSSHPHYSENDIYPEVDTAILDIIFQFYSEGSVSLTIGKLGTLHLERRYMMSDNYLSPGVAG